MSRFYASIQGNRGEATRMGTADSGIHGHIRGWDIGARVEVEPDRRAGGNSDNDIVYICATRGSNGARGELIASLTTEDKEPGQGVRVRLANTPMMREAARRLLEEDATQQRS